jgi:hypothetical protein
MAERTSYVSIWRASPGTASKRVFPVFSRRRVSKLHTAPLTQQPVAHGVVVLKPIVIIRFHPLDRSSSILE